LVGTAGLSMYMEIVLGSEFPQSKLLTPDKFIKYLKMMGIRLDKRRLEFYDKKGLLRLSCVTKSQSQRDLRPSGS
jgi:hypothetical protein